MRKWIVALLLGLATLVSVEALDGANHGAFGQHAATIAVCLDDDRLSGYPAEPASPPAASSVPVPVFRAVAVCRDVPPMRTAGSAARQAARGPPASSLS